MSRLQPSKSRSRSQLKTQKTYKAGKVTRNPFLNFLRDYRVSNKGLSITQVTVRGAEVWRKMSDQEKSSYLEMARQAPVRKYRRRRSRRRRGRSSRRRRRRRRRSMEEEMDDQSDTSDDYDDDFESRSRNFCNGNGKRKSSPGSSNQQ